MNGAELLVKAALLSGVEACFANAGTTELPIVQALGSTPGIKVFLGLFEGVCTGAADGYGRMLDKPAMTLLHLGPGFANGIANLHNARRACSPVLNVVGEHATWHRRTDPPLAMDIESLVKTVSGWWRTSRAVREISGDIARAVAEAQLGQVTTVVVPNDLQLARSELECAEIPATPFEPIDPNIIEAAASRLRTGSRVALMLGGKALRGTGLAAVARIRRTIGCDLFTQSLPGYMESGLGVPILERVPYYPEKAIERLSPYEVVLLAGTPEPVTFFGYPGVKSRILADQQEKITLCTDRQNVAAALEYLASALGCPASIPRDRSPRPPRPGVPDGELTPELACVTMAALQPENAIIVDEALTSGSAYQALRPGLPPHTLMAVSGGSIGYGMPASIGAAIACPDRPVINLQADGSGFYTVQALWTQAHEGLNVTTLICANRSYRILQMELARAGMPASAVTSTVIELKNPVVDWVRIARGFGVPGVSVSTAEDLAFHLRISFAEPGPHLIEMLLP